MTTVGSEHAQFAFDRTIAPVCVADPGEVVVFETGSLVLDRLVAGEPPASIGLERLNAVTGPLAVRGAAPGDALVVELLDVRIDAAWTVWLPGFGPLGVHTSEVRAARTAISEGRLTLPGGTTVLAHPMVGCIGVAPAEGSTSTLRPVSVTGGNMDLHELTPGTSIVLPVQVDGGLLSIGDLHAGMGHGEPTAVAFEAVGAATVRVGLEPGAAPPAPRLRTSDATTVIGLGTTLEEARASAVQQAYAHLVEERGLDPFAAYACISGAVDLTLGGPASPMVLARIPNSVGTDD
jgi:amidase